MMGTPASDLRSAYNAWTQINTHKLVKETDVTADELDLSMYPAGESVSKFRAELDIDPVSKKVSLEGRCRPRCRLGFELTNGGEKLVDLEDKFPIDE